MLAYTAGGKPALASNPCDLRATTGWELRRAQCPRDKWQLGFAVRRKETLRRVDREFGGYSAKQIPVHMTALPWEIRNIVADGNIVMTERIDNFQVGDTRISVPCMGTFELRDGKIAAWRDYWDLKYFEAQLPAKNGPS